MFHVELRKFPHNACSFNLTEAELARIVVPWSRQEWVEVGERKWNPHEARLTVLQGPQLALEDLQMGRGWHNAQHHSTDVTEQVIAQALASSTPPVAPAGGEVAGDCAASTPEARLRSLLGSDPAALLQAWQLAAQRRPELTPSESLALAESTLRSLDASSS